MILIGGGYNSVRGEINLIKEALNHADYDRLILLQGADYPIKSSEFILDFFDKNRDVEYCKCSRCTGSAEKFLYSRCCHISFMNNPNLLKKVWNKASSALNLNIRSGKILVDSTVTKADVFWGSAQWAFTGDAAKYIVEFHDRNPHFNNWFKYAFAPDELYFATVIMNSPYASRTNNKEDN
ncbi:MAG: beta-1,6-N-acetylglucosaminyltransferase, partial [Bacteroides sp.]|nr:beta-1,6-N-acetylglucosaminyltransferase [Bacteroides sp.]